jgi:riboflavin synthase
VFTGIVEGTGEVVRVEEGHGVRRLTLALPSEMAGLPAGASLSVSGACLTVVAASDRRVTVELVPETLARTHFTDLAAGDRVNLERPLTLSSPLGGHLVLGHVDGVAEVLERVQQGDGAELTVHVPPGLDRYLPTKAFVALEGVSLTVARQWGDRFTVALVPETLRRTTLGQARAGTRLNLEVDPLARYVERLLAARLDAEGRPA